MKAMRIFKEQELSHGHYQQFSLAKALDAVPGLSIGVADGGRLVNGNVFWGHGRLLKPKDVVSVHANWMESKLKGPCLREAGLWVDAGSPARLSVERWGERQPAASMDAVLATVESCGGTAATAADHKQAPWSQPMQLSPRPGCYLWLPTGCRQHTFRAQDDWRWTEDLKDQHDCLDKSREMYNAWCGVQDAQTRFVEHPARAPPEPGDAGCYVWMPSGCEKRNFHAHTSWRLTSASAYPSQAECTTKAPEKFNKWCDTLDARALWVAAPPAAPSEPGCYAWLPTGCKENLRNDIGWIRDVWGEQSSDARADREHCEDLRKDHIDAWCGVSNTKMAFVMDGP
jgi:hypothetical protein